MLLPVLSASERCQVSKVQIHFHDELLVSGVTVDLRPEHNRVVQVNFLLAVSDQEHFGLEMLLILADPSRQQVVVIRQPKLLHGVELGLQLLRHEMTIGLRILQDWLKRLCFLRFLGKWGFWLLQVPLVDFEVQEVESLVKDVNVSERLQVDYKLHQSSHCHY